MVHLKLDADGRLVPSGRRYCPICLPEMEAAGIMLLALFHVDGWWLYQLDDIEEAANGRTRTQTHSFSARA